MIDKDRLVRTLHDLVRIPSHESMEGISGYVAGEIRKLGLKPEVDRDGNVLSSIGSGPGLLLNAHMDTVGVKDYPDAFSGKVSGGKLYGRGSTDDKSGVAAMLELMRVLKKDPPRKRVVFAFTVWEEGGGVDKEDGANTIVRKVKATHGIVLEGAVKEPDRMYATVGCKGRFLYTIDVLGKPAHSGSPGKGINSIYLAAKLIDKLKEFGSTSMHIEGIGEVSSVLSVTQIDAREGNNIIPGRCMLTVDYRALPGENEPEIRRCIESICRQVLGKGFTLTKIGHREGYLSSDKAYTNMFRRAMEKEGLKFKSNISSGWLDGQVFDNHGIPTYSAGPGTMGQFHKTPEYCWIPGLVKGTRAILNVIREWDKA